MGGIGRVTQEVITHLLKADSDHQFTILLGMRSPNSLNWPGARIVQVDAAMIDEHFEQIGLPTLLEEMAVDLYLNTTFAIPALRTSRYQVSVIHDVVFEDQPQWVEPNLRSYLQRWSRFAAKHADRVITVSDHAAGRITKVYGLSTDRPVRIYNGIHEEAFKYPSRLDIESTQSRFQLDSPYLLYVGALEPKKGIDQLLSAFASLLKRHNGSIRLVLSGSHNPQVFDVMKQMEVSGLAPEQVRVLGYIPDVDRHALLAGCSSFVYPSLYEGFGLPPLEALALGKPCVIHDETSLPEVTGGEALSVDARDPEAFASALEASLFDESYRNRVSRSGPAHARKFNWDSAALEYLKLFDSLGAA